MFKLGDQVAIMAQGGVVCEIITLAEQNKKYWIIGDFLFEKSSGRCTNGWNITHIEPAEQKHFADLQAKRLRDKLRNTDWSKHDLGTLVAVDEIISIQNTDILFALLQIAEEMMFREKNCNGNLDLTHKMLQGVLKNYHELRNI